MRGGDHRAAVEASGTDEVIEHLGPDHPRVDHMRSLVEQALTHAFCHLRRGEPHVAPQADAERARVLAAQLGQDAGKRAAEQVRSPSISSPYTPRTSYALKMPARSSS